ncbi:hypothetical protein BaRGS_00037267 [Batillaria attramentaria]|uniref:Uncharacterized protein n=1 Tax=Batillaria attramentaria TaxID=370345 RepID=A0ABD0JAF5_9CAEN
MFPAVLGDTVNGQLVTFCVNHSGLPPFPLFLTPGGQKSQDMTDNPLFFLSLGDFVTELEIWVVNEKSSNDELTASIAGFNQTVVHGRS